MAKWIEHPDFSGIPPVRNDIALVRLEKPVNLSRSVIPVCLPLDPKVTEDALGVRDLNEGLLGVKSNLVGWGRTAAKNIGSISVSLAVITKSWSLALSFLDSRCDNASPARS